MIGFLVLVIDLYIWVVIASAILSWLIAFNVVNTNNRFVYDRRHALPADRACARPIRNILPNLGGIDISPVILILFCCSCATWCCSAGLAPAVIPSE